MLGELSGREFRIKQVLQSKGWLIEWRGVPNERWLWASKAEGPERGISMEIVALKVVSFRGSGTVAWLAKAVSEVNEVLEAEQPTS